MSTGSAAELFMSDHIEARVPVADITAKCAPMIYLEVQETELAPPSVLLHQSDTVECSPCAQQCIRSTDQIS